MNLIDKDAILAEIERRKKELIGLSNNFANRWACGSLDNILSFLNTLEAKEVNSDEDLDKEIQYMYKRDNSTLKTEKQYAKYAKHFFKLGLKYRKENKMDYKEKYEQALDNLKKIKAANKDNKELVDFIDYKYPELKESEDEKIRKCIIEYLEQSQFGEEHYLIDDDIVRGYISWLEKQGEQNTAWSEEDKIISNEIQCLIGNYRTGDDEHKLCSWIDNLKERVQPQPKQEWSKEDEIGLGDALWAIEQAKTIAKNENDMGNIYYAEKWLKSLRL